MRKHFETEGHTNANWSDLSMPSIRLRLYTLTSSFVFEDAEEMRAAFAEEKERNIYSRFSNPKHIRNLVRQSMSPWKGQRRVLLSPRGMGAVFGSFASFA